MKISSILCLLYISAVLSPASLLARTDAKPKNTIRSMTVFGSSITGVTNHSWSPDNLMQISASHHDTFTISDKYYCTLLDQCLREGQPCTNNESNDVRIVLLIKRTNTKALDTVSFGFSKFYNINSVTYKMNEKLIFTLSKRLPYEVFEGIDIILNLLRENDACYERSTSPVQSPDNHLYSANFLDTPPQFRGGPAALQQYIDTYLTHKFARIDYEGIITLRFEIDTLGFVDNLVAVGEEKGSLVYEACEKVQHTMPRWLPGMHNGKKVRSVYSLPVVFVMR